MHDVFISYSSLNKNMADAVCNRLESGGVKCWYAPRDIRPSDTWAAAIMNAIRQAKIFLLIFSEHSNRSGQVLNEVTAAFNAGCVIVPFRLDETQMCDELAYYLNTVHWMDALKPPMAEKIDQLYQTVRGILTTGYRGKRGRRSDQNNRSGERSVRKKSVILKVIALLLVAALIGGGIYATISHRPQEMKFFCMSHIGLERYPAMMSGMISPDSELLFLRNAETGLLSLVEMTSGNRILSDLAYEPADPLMTNAFVHRLYDTVYFIEKDQNIVRIYDRENERWHNAEGIKLELSEEESVYTHVFYGENLMSENENLEAVTLLIYDYQESADCFSKIITVNPDGELTVHDISELRLDNLICAFDRPDCAYILFMDQSNHVKLIDMETGMTVESDVRKILEEYMPDAVVYDGLLSSSKRYVHQKEYLDSCIQAKVWDLESGNTVLNEKFSMWYDLQFSGDHEATYFDCSVPCLYTCDLQTGRTATKLDQKYFSKNAAFLDIPYSFYYAEEFGTYFFLSQEVSKKGKETSVRLTMTDTDGKVLAMSDDIDLPFGDHMPTIQVCDDFVLLTFTPYEIGEPEDGVCTVIYRALYSVDEEGNMLFSENYY